MADDELFIERSPKRGGQVGHLVDGGHAFNEDPFENLLGAVRLLAELLEFLGEVVEG